AVDRQAAVAYPDFDCAEHVERELLLDEGRGGLGGRELVEQTRGRELVEMLRLVHVFEVMLAKVIHVHVGEWGVAEELTGRLRNDDLSTVAGRADASGAMDSNADVPLAGRHGFAGMDSHPHPQVDFAGPPVSCERPLALKRRGDRVLGPSEC